MALRATSHFLNSNVDLVETAMETVDKWLYNDTDPKKKKKTRITSECDTDGA